MLKRFLIFIAFLFLAIIVYVESIQLFLAFFVFFPMLLLPILYFMEDTKPHNFYTSLLFALGIFAYFLFLKGKAELFFLGCGAALLLAFFWFYRRLWHKAVLIETAQCEEIHQQLEALKTKHQSRLESLHHLEKQVAGLLDLFEIARDFNDCLSFEAIASILDQRVRPELSFQQMYLALGTKRESEFFIERVISINERGVQDHLKLEQLPEGDLKRIQTARETRKMDHESNDLTFPLIVDGEVAAFLLIKSMTPDDLAKFEVLAAYLTLQIKKVRLYEEVKELSIQDGLTGVFVRRHFMERLDEELKRSLKFKLPLAVLMLDIDHFKRYNDTYGHLAGDATLKQVASLLFQNLRRVDMVARYGGEEFVVLIPETRQQEVLEVAERVRSNIARHNFKVYNHQARVTLSIGVALFPDDILDTFPNADADFIASELIQRADKALYRAKEEGRNRVILFRDSE